MTNNPQKQSSDHPVTNESLPVRIDKISLGLYCDHTYSLGEECVALLCIQRDSEFELTVWMESEFLDEESVETVQTEGDPGWRPAALTLLAHDEFTIGPEGCRIAVDGVEDPFASILTRCWTRELEPEVLHTAAAFTDAELRGLWAQVHAAEEAKEVEDPDDVEDLSESVPSRYFELLDQLSTLLPQCGLTGSNLGEVAARLDSTCNFEMLLECLRSYAGTEGIRSYLDENADEYCLSDTVLSDAWKYPSPSDSEVVTQLLYSWVRSNNKPLSQSGTSMIFPSGSELPFLQWLLAYGVKASYRALVRDHPEEATWFIDWLERNHASSRCQPSRDYWGIGRARNRARHDQTGQWLRDLGRAPIA